MSDSMREYCLHARGCSYFRKNQLEMALADFTDAHRLNRSNPIPLLFRAELYYWLKRYDLAILDCTAVLGLDATEPRAYLMRSNSFEAKGDATRSRLDRERWSWHSLSEVRAPNPWEVRVTNPWIAPGKPNP